MTDIKTDNIKDGIVANVKPENGPCGECEKDVLFLPIFKEVRGNIELAWRCSNCGRMLDY